MKEDFYETRNSIYCYDNTNILINKLDTKDIKILSEIEKRIVFAKLYELRQINDIDNLDLIHFLRNSQIPI